MKNSILPFLTLIFVLAIFTQCQSATLVQSKEDYYRNYEKEVQPEEWVEVNFDFAFTSLSLTLNSPDKFEGVKLAFPGEDTIEVTKDDHFLDEERVKSNLLLPETTTNKLHLYTGRIEGKVNFHLFNSRTSGYKPTPQRSGPNKSQKSCKKPGTISQDQWREGLLEPEGTVVPTEVNHSIVHHTATANEPNDPEQVVRDIYLDHRITNGWNDIGYNFLIDHTGRIYEGRDGLGEHDDDNVRGAHFCGQNSGTIGIGMLGTFSTREPANDALQSLYELMAWKFDKEDIHPLSNADHPLEDNLNAIAGHRQGCATECPGEEWFNDLEETRSETADLWEECTDDPSVSLSSLNSANSELSPNPADDFTRLKLPKSFEVLDIEAMNYSGQRFSVNIKEKSSRNSSVQLSTAVLKPGLYKLIISTPQEQFIVENALMVN